MRDQRHYSCVGEFEVFHCSQSTLPSPSPRGRRAFIAVEVKVTSDSQVRDGLRVAGPDAVAFKRIPRRPVTDLQISISSISSSKLSTFPPLNDIFIIYNHNSHSEVYSSPKPPEGSPRSSVPGELSIDGTRLPQPRRDRNAFRLALSMPQQTEPPLSTLI